MITLYHGSDFLFNRFQFVNVGKKGGTSGAGFGIYLTDNQEDAACYGKYLYTVDVQLRAEISNTKITFQRNTLRTFLRYFESISPNSYIENWGNENEAIKQLLTCNESDTDIVNEIINATGSQIEMMDTLSHFGYTHAIDLDTPNKFKKTNKPTTNFVIFDLSCMRIRKREVVKNIENLNESAYEDNEIYDGLRNLATNRINADATKYRVKTLTQQQGRAKSKSQRRLMAMALAYKRGKLDPKYASDTIKKLAASIEQSTLHDFAATKQKKRRKDGSVGKRNNIPQYVQDSKYKKKK